MYHALVKRISLRNFERVNNKDYEPLLHDCVPEVHHRFGGDHALGGERHDRETLRLWFARLGRVAPTLRLIPEDIWVKDTPRDTVVILRWSATQDMPDGSPYRNHGVHIIRLRWLKVVSIDANEDSQAVAEGLKVQSRHGLDEALAAPITS